MASRKTATGTSRSPALKDIKMRDTSMVGVLVKAFHALEAMAEAGEPMPLRDISKLTRLPKGTLFRILQTLHTLGYVNQVEETSYYYLTSQVSHLGRNARQEDLKMMALPLMKQLQTKFNETVNLGILEGMFVYYVAVLEAQRPLAWRVPTGTRDMFYSTALGRAIAAHLTAPLRDTLLDRTNLKSRTASTVENKAQLEAILDKVQADGVSFDLEENDAGVVCVGAPLFVNKRVVASVSLSIPSSRYTAALGEEVAEEMRRLDMNFTTNNSASRIWAESLDKA